MVLKLNILTGSAMVVAEIKLDARMCVKNYNACRAMGRSVLRNRGGGDTVAVGVVEEVGQLS